MQATLPTPDELRQHPCVQALAASHAAYALPYLSAEGDIGGGADVGAYDVAPNPRLDANTQPKLWLACSGGRDSLSLALAAWALHLPVTLIHINHQLQAPADDWQALVASFAKRLHMPLVCHRLTLAAKDEASARSARFAAIANDMQADDVLLLGHHMDDQAETLLLNLFRGAGLRGLSAMQPWQTRSINGKPVTLWRPWLGVRRAQLTEFAVFAGLEFVDDPTNTLFDGGGDDGLDIVDADCDTAIDGVGGSNTTSLNAGNARAFLRSRIIPHLSARFGDVIPAIARTSDLAREADNILQGVLSADKAQAISGGVLDIKILTTLPKARQYQLLADFIQTNSPYAPSRQQVQILREAALSTSADQRFILEFADTHIRRFQDKLYRLPNQLAVAKDATCQLALGASLALPSGTWQVAAADKGLDLALLGQPLFLRAKQAGERLHMEGRVGRWPLKKFLQSLNLPPWQRLQVHVLCDAAHIPVALICAAGFFMCAGSVVDNGWRLVEVP